MLSDSLDSSAGTPSRASLSTRHRHPHSHRRRRRSSNSSSASSAHRDSAMEETMSPKRSKKPRHDNILDDEARVNAEIDMCHERVAKARGQTGQRPRPFHAPHMGTKKLLVINNSKNSTQRPEASNAFYAGLNRDVSESLKALLHGETGALSNQRLYNTVEHLCRKGSGADVTQLLQDRFDEHLRNDVLPRIQELHGASDLEILRSLVVEWDTWTSRMRLIRSTFSFVDRTYLLRNGKPQINTMAIASFRKMAFTKATKESGGATEPPIGTRAIAGMCDIIRSDRGGQQHGQEALLRDSIRMLFVMDVYLGKFEPEFLSQSKAYLADFAETWSTASLKDYVAAGKKLLERESHRCIAYSFDTLTQQQLTKLAHRALIEKHAKKLLDAESLTKLLAGNETEPLQGVYDLLQLSKLQSKLKDPWTRYIKASGSAIIGDEHKGDEMVMDLLVLRKSLSLVVRDALHDDSEFFRAMREAFGTFMNDKDVAASWSSGTSKVGEMLAKHIDMLLRGGLKSLPGKLLSDVKDRATAERKGQSTTGDEDAELERQLEQAIELFRFLEGKDVFEAFYKKDLARRLLMGRSASEDAERMVLTKLRNECGSNFTQNLEQMFKDQGTGRDEMEGYKLYCDSEPERQLPVDLQVMILSASAWPSYPDTQLNIPGEVAKQLEQFETFYKAKHTGRVLTWKHGLAHCYLKAVFARGTKELQVSSFQAVVLLLFNSVPADGFLSYDQIAAATGLQGGDLVRSLQSLACGKLRVLSKHPKSREVGKTDTFTFNRAFWDPKFRIKINQIQLKETKEENKETHDKVARDRRYETQAAVVRIMKSRKQVGHAELVSEVIGMLKSRGTVEPAAIKKDIETLIDKEYLEREGNSYVYLA